MPQQRAENMNWQRRPDEIAGRGQWHLKRCPAKGDLDIVCLSHDLIGHYTHYYGGRTRPCNQTNCEACNKNMRPRWNGYFAAIDLKTNEKLIVEIPAAASQLFGECFDRNRTMIGTRIRLTRTGTRANGRITIRFAPPAAGTGELEKAPDLRPILARIWEVHETQSALPLVAATFNLRPTGTDDLPDHGGTDRQLD